MIDYNSAQGSLNPLTFFKWLKFKIDFAKNNPDYFNPDGLFVFVGGQGSGKTLSVVSYVRNLMVKYPLCKLCTNLLIKDFPIVSFEKWVFAFDNINNLNDEQLFDIYTKENRVFPFENNDDLSKYKNDDKGVIFLIDEIQLYLNSLQSKNVNMETMTELAQQRKQRVHIVCTSQVFGRIAKPVREQFSSIILCQKRFFGALQVNLLIDRDSIANEGDASSSDGLVGTVVKKFRWFHSPEMYGNYDTYYKIVKGNFVDGDNKKGGIDYDL